MLFLSENQGLLSSTAVIIVIASVITLTMTTIFVKMNAFGNINNSQNMDSMMDSMMNKQPQDVTVAVKSNPIIPVGKESEIKLLVLDKHTYKPMTGAQVIIGIERGPAMTSMDMVDSMFNALEQGKDPGVYVVRFTPDSKGIYTIHTHIVPNGKSMSSMLDNHVDLGIVAEDNL